MRTQVPAGLNRKEAEIYSRLDSQRLPHHIAIIMDGNGRWAKRRHLPRVAGHRSGVSAVRSTIEITPPELISDLMAHGIALAGGGALLRGLDRRLAQETKFPVYVAEDPLSCVVRGTGEALEETEMLAKVQARLGNRRVPR